MSDIGGGNSGFDGAFFCIEFAGALAIVLLLVLHRAMRDRRGASLPTAALLGSAALVLGPGISIYWQVAYPSANGIEGAGRFLLGGGVTLFNSAFAGVCALALLPRPRRWIAFVPAALDVVYWLLFLLV